MPRVRYHASPARRALRKLGVALFLTAAMAWILFGLGVVIYASHAAPPENSSHEYHDWYQGLKQPGSGTSCCSISDCRHEPWRQTSEGYEALIDGEWVKIPGDKVLQQIPNPTGDAVTCHAGKTIFCFARVTES